MTALTWSALAVGVVVELGVTAWTGGREAWDSPLFWRAGMPAMILASFLIGRADPERWLRWGVLPVVGQFAAMILRTGGGSMLPVGVVFAAALCLPCLLAAWVGGWTRRRARKIEGTP